MTFINKIISSFNEHSDRNAFCIEDVSYTYEDLALKVSSIRDVIDQSPDEERIGILISDDIETYAAVIAVLLSGKTYIPIHPTHPQERIQQIIQQSGLKLILSKNRGYAFQGVTVTDTAATTGSQNATFIAPAFDPAQKNAYILFTSGSTGIPKGVPVSYHNVDSFVDAFFALGYRTDENDRFLQMFDLTFDLSVMSYLVPLCIGACVYTIPESGIKYANVYNILESHKITFALMVPSILAYLRPYFGEVTLPEMRYNLFCGEALYKDLLTEWMNCVPNAIVENVYGPTEATIFCLTYSINKTAGISAYNEIVSIGKAMKNMEAVVVDEHQVLLADGTKGELCLYGEQVTPGYLSEEKNKEAFFKINNKRYYRTGDIAYRNEQGDFMYCGRADQQVKIQGYRIELSEVEFHLRKIAGSAEVVALAIYAANGVAQIEVVFEDKATDIDSVIAELKTKLPAYMMPVQIHFVSPFPLNANGKTDRKAIEKMIKKTA